MDYVTWRLSFQSVDQAAASAFNELAIVVAERDALRNEVARLRLFEPGRRSEHKITMAPHVGPTNWPAWGIAETESN